MNASRSGLLLGGMGVYCMIAALIMWILKGGGFVPLAGYIFLFGWYSVMVGVIVDTTARREDLEFVLLPILAGGVCLWIGDSLNSSFWRWNGLAQFVCLGLYVCAFAVREISRKGRVRMGKPRVVGVHAGNERLLDVEVDLSCEPSEVWVRCFNEPNATRVPGVIHAPRLSASTMYLTPPDGLVREYLLDLEIRIKAANFMSAVVVEKKRLAISNEAEANWEKRRRLRAVRRKLSGR